MSLEKYLQLFQNEMNIYRQIDKKLKKYGKSFNPALTTDILRNYELLLPLLDLQVNVFKALLKSDEFQKNNAAFFHFITHTVRFKDLDETNQAHFCMSIFKIMQSNDGKQLIDLLNALHENNNLIINTEYSTASTNYKMMTSTADLTPKEPNFFWICFEFFASCITTALSFLNPYQEKSEYKSPPTARNVDFHYPKNTHQTPPSLYAGTKQALVISIGFIKIAHELIHTLHFAQRTRVDTNFPHPPLSPIWMLYGRYTKFPRHEELATIEGDDSHHLSENLLREGFEIAPRGSHFSAPLSEKEAIKNCTTLAWIAKKRIQKETLSPTERVNVGMWHNPYGDPSGKFSTPDILSKSKNYSLSS